MLTILAKHANMCYSALNRKLVHHSTHPMIVEIKTFHPWLNWRKSEITYTVNLQDSSSEDHEPLDQNGQLAGCVILQAISWREKANQKVASDWAYKQYVHAHACTHANANSEGHLFKSPAEHQPYNEIHDEESFSFHVCFISSQWACWDHRLYVFTAAAI